MDKFEAFKEANQTTEKPSSVLGLEAASPQLWKELREAAQRFHREEQPMHQRQASLRAIAYNAGLSLNDRQVKYLDQEAERAINNWKDGYDASESIRVPVTKWLWENIILLGCVNLLIAREKVGKTA